MRQGNSASGTIVMEISPALLIHQRYGVDFPNSCTTGTPSLRPVTKRSSPLMLHHHPTYRDPTKGFEITHGLVSWAWKVENHIKERNIQLKLHNHQWDTATT